MRGRLRTFGLFAALTALMMVAALVASEVGLVTNLATGILVFGLLAFAINFATYFWSHKFVVWSYKVRFVTPEEAPRLHRTVRRIAERANLPMPKVGVIPMQEPNAFATGRNPKNALVAASVGLLEMMDDEELEGVMAHEMAHVGNRDTLIMMVAATVAGAITFAARMMFWNALFGGGDNRNPATLAIGFVFMLLAPIAAIVVQLAISRRREFEADREGARLSGKPLALARALRKIEDIAQRRPLTERQASSATASLFIVNPFRGGGMSAMFRTHPLTDDRVRRLEQMAGIRS